MSLLTTSDGLLVLARWSEDVLAFVTRLHPEVVAQVPTTPSSDLSHAYVPPDLENIASWATIVDDKTISDIHRRKILVYAARVPRPVVPFDARNRITLKLHGFVKSANLSTFGDWKGDSNSIGGAVHHLALHSGGCREAWQLTTAPLNALAEYARMMLGIQFDGPFPIFTRKLVFQHRVFVKPPVHPSTVDSGSFTLDDPYGLYEKIPLAWGLDKQPAVLSVAAAGAVKPLPAMLLGRGDFIEVDAAIDLVVAQNASNRRTLKVFMSFCKVLRIASNSELTNVTTSKRNRADDALEADGTNKKHRAATDLDSSGE